MNFRNIASSIGDHHQPQLWLSRLFVVGETSPGRGVQVRRVVARTAFHQQSWDVGHKAQSPLYRTEATNVGSSIDLRDHVVQGCHQSFRLSSNGGVGPQKPGSLALCTILASGRWTQLCARQLEQLPWVRSCGSMLSPAA